MVTVPSKKPSVEFYIRVPPCAPANEIASFVSQCEDAGFTGIGFLDSPLLLRELFVTMTAAAQSTSSIRLATAVTNPSTRHASVTASAAKTIEEIAPGRVDLWIGRGMTATGTIGQSPASLRELKKSIETIRLLLSGKPVDFNGINSQLRHSGTSTIPVYIAASGPKALELAGSIADGVLIETGIHPNVIAKVRNHIAEGAEKVGRDPKNIKLIVSATTIIDNDLNAARERARILAVHWIVEKQFSIWLRTAEIDIDNLNLPSELWDLYPDVGHAVNQEKAQELCSFLPEKVLTKICDTLGFIGPPDYCLERVREVSSYDLDGLFLKGESTYELPNRELGAFRETVFPSLMAR